MKQYEVVFKVSVEMPDNIFKEVSEVYHQEGIIHAIKRYREMAYDYNSKPSKEYYVPLPTTLRFSKNFIEQHIKNQN